MRYRDSQKSPKFASRDTPFLLYFFLIEEIEMIIFSGIFVLYHGQIFFLVILIILIRDSLYLFIHQRTYRDEFRHDYSLREVSLVCLRKIQNRFYFGKFDFMLCLIINHIVILYTCKIVVVYNNTYEYSSFLSQ